jgi:hypothetical protein
VREVNGEIMGRLLKNSLHLLGDPSDIDERNYFDSCNEFSRDSKTVGKGCEGGVQIFQNLRRLSVDH